VVVDRDRQRPLGGFLADDVLVQDRVDLTRLRQRLELEARRRRQLLVDDLVAEVDALIADVDAGACDQLLDLPLRLPAEAAEELLVGVGRTCQGFFPSPRGWIENPRPRLRNPATRNIRLLLAGGPGPCKRARTCNGRDRTQRASPIPLAR